MIHTDLTSLISYNDSVGQIQFGVAEYTKSIQLQLSYDSPSAAVTLVNATFSQIGQATCVVRYNDSSLVIFATESVEVVETAGVVNVVLERTGGTRGAAVVRMKSSLSSALIAGKVDQLVKFQDGEASTVIALPIQDSDEFEVRSFTLTLTNTTAEVQATSSKMAISVLDKGDVSLPAYPDLVIETTTGGKIETFVYPHHFIGGDWAYISSYVVSLRSLGDTTWKTIESWNSYFVMYDLESLTSYEVTAAVRNQRGWSDLSPVVVVSTTSPTVPDPVWTLMVVMTTGGAVYLEWQEPQDKGGSPILEYRVRVLDSFYTELRALSIANDSRHAAVGDLNPWTNYVFFITPVNQVGLGGTSGASASTTGVTAPGTPPAPALVNATGGMLYLSILGPVDCGGAPLLSYTLHMARLIVGDLAFRAYASEDIQAKGSDGVVGTVGVNGLLFNSIYVFRVTVRNAQVRLPLSIDVLA